MRSVILLLAVALVLAGCSDDGGGEEAEQEFEFEEAELESGKGLIRGVVIDGTITPIPDAHIELNDGSTTTSNENGIFQFIDMEPGAYFITVSKPGYSTVQSSADVVAGDKDPAVLKIMVERLPFTEPYATTYVDSGFIACGWGVPITYGYCGDDLGLGEDDFRLLYPIDGHPDWIQVEIHWDSNQAASDNLYMINAICPPENKDGCPGAGGAGHRWDEGTFQSPAIMRSPANFTSEAAAAFGAESLDGWYVGIDVSADGPVLATGVTIDQEFTGYTTMFWNIDPEEDWTFAEDGAYPY